MKKIKNLKSFQFKRYTNLVIGLLLAAFSFNLFLSPNDITAGGISGMSVVIHKMTGMNISTFMMIANIILLITSLVGLGKEQTGRTIVGSILFPIFVSLTLPLTNLFDLQDVDILIKVLFGGIISGVGYGIIFKSSYTSGGTDILNQLVSKYYHIPMTASILLVDGFVVLSGGIVFGIEKMVYSAIALVLISIYSNKSMLDIGKQKSFYISSTKSKEIEKLLINEFGYNITKVDGTGGFSKKDRDIILCVVTTDDYYEVNAAIKLIDKNAFITITDSYEVINHQNYKNNKK
jgi:uncharacterized membrane-anchored protein YitT (DUF2179 family)